MRTLLRPRHLAEPPRERTSDRSGAGLAALGGAAAMAGVAIGLFLAERRAPLRRQTRAGRERVARNLAMGAMSMAVVAIVQTPLVQPLSERAERRRRGLVQRLPLPGWARDAAAFLLMDYTIYAWHVATHRHPFLWRFHLVHHLDQDLDTTTALRFHAADMAISIPYRALQVALIGAGPRALRVWQAWFFVSVLFHHSNVRLPAGFERRVARLLTTPRMHGVHHTSSRAETNSNWSSGLSLWDHLHGTFRWEAEQRESVIGVPAYRAAGDVELLPSLALPFRAQRNAWAPEGRSLAQAQADAQENVPLS